MTVMEKQKSLKIKKPEFFSLDRTLDCGQCFRFEKKDGMWQGVAFGRVLKIRETEKELELNISKEEFENVFSHYFDFERDYKKIDEILTEDDRFKVASKYAAGIHILNQQPFETLCSFIISQNNNIPRIKGIIRRFCETAGKPLSDGEYSFPDAAAVARMTAEDFAPLRAGFRVKYLMDAAQKVAGGEVSLNIPADMPLEDAEAELCKIKGVGKKVADCVLLFSMGRMDAFPSDVWIKRVMAELFPKGLPERLSPYAGIAQQYLYHYSRVSGEF